VDPTAITAALSADGSLPLPAMPVDIVTAVATGSAATTPGTHPLEATKLEPGTVLSPSIVPLPRGSVE
jgi:hypothetical protein